jgi:hypothetical protein
MIKLMRANQNLIHHFSERLKISSGSERLGTFTVFFLIFLHVSSCIFIMIASVEDDSVIKWVDKFQDMDDFELYVVSCYFVLTTTATVGYGDIFPVSTFERLYCMVLMLIGVLTFTFISGALSSIL